MPPAPPLAVGPLPGAALDQLARDIAGTHGHDHHATLVRARPVPGGVEVGLCSLPAGVHPAEALLGHVVGPEWAASGIVAPARARPIEDAAAHGTGTPTTVVVLIGRDGHVTSHVTGVAGATVGGAAPVGRLPDLLRRTLGLPTPPLRAPAAEWWRACWLDALVGVAAADPGGVDPDRPLTSTLPPALVRALVADPALCTAAGWARLRRLAAAPEAPVEPGDAAVRATVVPHVEPEVAAWMDDGCFGRWLLDALPSVDELLDLAAGLVAPELLDLLREVVQRADPPADGPASIPDREQGRR